MPGDVECCRKCGIKLFEYSNTNARKIFRSFATKFSEDGSEYHLCINCYKGNVQEERKENEEEDE